MGPPPRTLPGFGWCPATGGFRSQSLVRWRHLLLVLGALGPRRPTCLPAPRQGSHVERGISSPLSPFYKEDCRLVGRWQKPRSQRPITPPYMSRRHTCRHTEPAVNFSMPARLGSWLHGCQRTFRICVKITFDLLPTLTWSSEQL